MTGALQGRQIAHMICEYFRGTGAHEAVLDHTDLLRVTLHGYDIQGFDNRWNQVLLSMRDLPTDSILETLYNMPTRGSVQLQTVLAMYEQEVHQDRSRPNYQNLKTMVRRHSDQKIRTRNSKSGTKELQQADQDLERIKMSALKGSKEAINGKQKDSDQKEYLAVSATTIVSMESKHNRRFPAPRPQTQNVGKRLSKGNAPKGSSPPGKIYQKPRRYFLDGISTNPSCDCWRPPVCQKLRN